MLATIFGVPVLGQVLTWLFSPMGKIVMVMAAFLAWTTYQRHEAASEATAQCRAVEIAADLKEMTRQRDAAWAAIADAEKRQAADDAAMAKLEAEGDAIKTDFAKFKTACSVPRNATKRMRNIR